MPAAVLCALHADPSQSKPRQVARLQQSEAHSASDAALLWYSADASVLTLYEHWKVSPAKSSPTSHVSSPTGGKGGGGDGGGDGGGGDGGGDGGMCDV